MSFWPETCHHNLQPLKHICSINPETLPETTDPDYEFEYIDIGNVTLESGVVGRERMTFGKSPSRARKPVRPNDVIVSTVRTYLKAVASISPNADRWVVSTGFAVLRNKPSVEPRYLYRVVQSNPFVESVVAVSTGVSYPAINPTTLGRIPVPLPERKAQRLIADFLDRETARIDQLIEKRESFLKLVDEKKTALTALAVNGSILDGPAGGETGWFGALPADWTVRRAKLLFRERDTRSVTGEEELLTVSHITGVTSRAEKDVNMFLAESMEGYKLVFKGDIAVNTMWAWMGALGVSPLDGLISPSYGVYAPTGNHFTFRYLDLLLRSRPFVAEVNRRSKGVWSSRLRLYPDAFLDIPFPVPEIDVQNKILAALDSATEREDKLAAASLKSLDRLREFRAALITAAVTGRIDVATWGKRGETDRRLDKIEEEMAEPRAAGQVEARA